MSPSPSLSFEPRAGVTLGGRFVLEEPAGSGGMGQVFRALDEHTGDRVAVKLLHGSAAGHVPRFLREAELLAQLAHPGIVRYIAHGESPALYLVLEWLEGEDLGHRLSRSPLDLRQALGLSRQVAEALLAAHARGVVHRDIKPSNIFLRDGNDVKLLDFGIARLLEGTRALTLSGQVVGTVGYMAPEQAREAREVGAEVDVFSLGCVLFECLTGRAAFPGDRLMAVLAKILFAETPRVSDLRESVPAALDDLVARMMHKLPEERPTLQQVAATLDAVLEGAASVELKPRVVTIGRTPEAPAISGNEQRVLSVVIASDRARVAPGEAPPTLSVREINAVRRELSQAVTAHGGRLELLADGSHLVVMSGGGSPSDRAAQAARCALALRRRLPEVRLAVATGRGDPSAESELGEVVTRAAQLLDLVPPGSNDGGAAPPGGGIRIDQTTAGLLDQRFELGGDAQSLELLCEREPAEPARLLLGRPTPFVGRARELTLLTSTFDECLREPVANAVIVTAPAGAGKSRLRREFLRGLSEHTPEAAVWLARGAPIAPGSSFALLGQLVRGIAGLCDGELPEVWRRKLSARVARHVAPDDVARVTEFLGELVGARFSDQGRAFLRAARADAALMGDQMRRAWLDFLAAECAARPVVIVLEDLHWGDLPSVRFLDASLRALSDRPLLVLALGRPELLDQFPDLWSDRRVQELRLPELTQRAATDLVTEVLGERADTDTAEAIVQRAAGNAYYLEELIRAVAEGRGDALPDTVLAMAEGRLERLGAGARRILRAASVFGHAFWVNGVASLVDDRRENVIELLRELARREFVVPSPSSRFRGEEEYAFRHVLVRDAAYDMLPERDRVRGHRQAAAWLEAAGERDAIVMAEHLERGGEPQGAVVWYLWAAEQAFEGNDLDAVFARAERGIQCGATGAVLGELRLLQAEALGWGARGADHATLVNEALLLSPKGSGAHARAAAELSVASCRRGDEAALKHAVATLQQVGTPSGRTPAPSVAHVLAIARTASELWRTRRGELAEPLVAAVARADIAFEEDRPIIEATRAWLQAAQALYAGDPEPLASGGEALVTQLESCGQLRYAMIVELQIVLALVALGADAPAIERAEAAIERARGLGLVVYAESARAQMPLPLERLGRLEEAEAVARACYREALSSSDRFTEARARARLAALRLDRGATEEAEREARAILSTEDYPGDARADAAVTLTEALLSRGQAAGALTIAERGLELSAAGSVRGDGALRWAHARALQATGDTEGAARALTAAAERLQARADALRDPRWREPFLAIPEHRGILGGR